MADQRVIVTALIGNPPRRRQIVIRKPPSISLSASRESSIFSPKTPSPGTGRSSGRSGSSPLSLEEKCFVSKDARTANTPPLSPVPQRDPKPKMRNDPLPSPPGDLTESEISSTKSKSLSLPDVKEETGSKSTYMSFSSGATPMILSNPYHQLINFSLIMGTGHIHLTRQGEPEKPISEYGVAFHLPEKIRITKIRASARVNITFISTVSCTTGLDFFFEVVKGKGNGTKSICDLSIPITVTCDGVIPEIFNNVISKEIYLDKGEAMEIDKDEYMFVRVRPLKKDISATYSNATASFALAMKVESVP